VNANGPIQEPDLRSLLLQYRDEIFASLNCVQVGTIVSYDPANGPKASVRLNSKRVVYNQQQSLDGKLQQTPQLIDYPVLADVVVMVLGGGDAFVQLPIKAGDECVVLFNDRDLDVWFATGSTAAPNSSRMHSLSDAIAIVGVKSLATKRGNITADAAGIVLGTASILISTDGTITITGKDAAGVVTIATDGTITVDAKAKKIAIKNASGSLKAALDQLFTALTSWTDTRGDTPNPATLTAINAAKTATDAILA
jgi:Phage protein Gp138 N-terminal domain